MIASMQSKIIHSDPESPAAIVSLKEKPAITRHMSSSRRSWIGVPWGWGKIHVTRPSLLNASVAWSARYDSRRARSLRALKRGSVIGESKRDEQQQNEVCDEVCDQRRKHTAAKGEHEGVNDGGKDPCHDHTSQPAGKRVGVCETEQD